MAFIGGLISGAAEGVASRHQEKRKFDQEQKLQDTRIQGESLERMKQERLKTQLDLIMNSSSPWSQKSVQIKQAMLLSGMKEKEANEFVQTMAPAGAVHDAAQAQGLTDVPSGPNVSAGSPARAVDPKEYGRHLGTAIGEHQLRGGDPKALDLAPNIGTLLGHLSAPAPQGQAQSQASFGDPGDLSSPPPPGQAPAPPGGAQGSASPAPTPQDQGPQVSLGELSGSSSGESNPSPRVSPPTPEPFPDAETLKTWDKKKGGPNGQISYKPPDAEWNGNGWSRPAPQVASQVSFGTPGAVPGEANSKISYGTPGAPPPPLQGMAPAIQGNGQLGIGAIPSIPASPIAGGTPQASDPNASVTQTPPTPQEGSGPSAEESPQESPQQFSDRLNSGPSARKPQATPSSNVPSKPDPWYTAPNVRYHRELEENKNAAESSRDVAKIKSQNEEKFNRIKNTLQMMREGGGGDQNEPIHVKMSASGEPEYDAGKTHVAVAQGKEIEQKAQYKGGPAIDDNAFYKGTKYADGAIHWQKIPGVKGRVVVPDSTSPTGFVSAATTAGGQISTDPELRSPVAPPASQITRNTEREQMDTDPNTGERVKRVLKSTSGPQAPATGPAYSPQSGVWDTPEGASRAIAGGANPPPGLNPTQQASVKQAMDRFAAQAAQTPRPQATPSSPVPSRQIAIAPPSQDQENFDAAMDVIGNRRTYKDMNLPRPRLLKIGAMEQAIRTQAINAGSSSELPPVLKGADRSLAIKANEMVPVLDRIKQEVADLDAKGKLGVWNGISGLVTLAENRAGSGDGEYKALETDLKLANGMIGRIHYSRNGVETSKILDKFTDPGYKNKETLLAGLNSIQSLLKTYGGPLKSADWVLQGAQRPGGSPPGGGGSLDDFKKKHGLK